MLSYGRQCIEKDDIQAVIETLQSDWLTQGPAVARFESELSTRFSVPYATAVSNGTAALHLAGLALGWGPGDLIVTTPLTFVASANCALYCGASVDFADIDPVTYTLDPKLLEKKIQSLTREGKRVKAVVAVDYAGHPCDWKKLREIADRYSLQLVDDACHALGARYEGEELCSAIFADLTVLSFHPVKHVTTGEGGAVLTRSRTLHERIQLLRTHGITKSPQELKKNEGPWYYEMQGLGFNYRISDILCALGASQLRKLDRFLEKRREIASYYDETFAGAPLIRTPKVAKNSLHAYHLYPLLIDFSKAGIGRPDYFERLKEKGILLQVHYIPVHLQPYYQEHFGFRRGDFPISEAFYDQQISIPMHPGLSKENLKDISTAILDSL